MKSLTGVEVFAVGRWNGMTFGAADLAAMAQAFDNLKGFHKVPLKLGHNPEQPVTDGKPALGWVTALYVQGDKLCADFEDVPNVVVSAIKRKLYRRVSIELSVDVRYKGKHIPFVVDAVALLGADLPAVNTLADLNAFLSRDAAQFNVGKRAEFSAVAGSIQEKAMDENGLRDAVEKAVAAATAPLKQQLEPMLARNFSQETQDMDRKETQELVNEALAPIKSALNELIQVIDPSRARVTSAFSKDVGAGSVTYEDACSVIDKRARSLMFEKSITYAAAKHRVLELDENLAIAYSAGPSGRVQFTPDGAGDGKTSFTKEGAGDLEKPLTGTLDRGQAGAEVDKRIKERMEGTRLSYSAAKHQVLSEDDDLAKAYMDGRA